MRLTSVTLENFRGYSDPVTIRVDDFTAFVGRNDVGKSTILEALDIFFGGGTIEFEKADVCKRGLEKPVRIGCTFEVSDDEIVLDQAAKTTLRNEYLLDADGTLTIVKSWDPKPQKPTAKVFARAYHPSAKGLDKLLSADNDKLKDLVKSKGLEHACSLSVNPSMRQALWAHEGDLKLTTQELRLDDPATKAVWERISAQLPEFALFQSDRASTIEDAEVQTPMKLAVKRAIADVGPEVDVITKKVIAQALQIAQGTVEMLQESFPEVAGDFKPRLKKAPDLAKLFDLELDDQEGVPVDKRGSGVRRLILLSFFLAEVERRRKEAAAGVSPRRMIYAIEEPETGQHPRNQILILDALRALSGAGDQVMITTHNPALAARLPTDTLRFVARTENGAPEVRAGAGTLAQIANDLGVFPDPIARPTHQLRVALVVEGPHDEDALAAFSQTLYQSKHIAFCLETHRDQIFVVIGGGSNLQHWVNRQHLDKLGLPQVYIYDSDKTSAAHEAKKATLDQLDALHGKPNVHAFMTRRRCMDNYLHLGTVARELAEPKIAAVADQEFVDMETVFAKTIMPAISAKAAATQQKIHLADIGGGEVELKSRKAKEWISRYFMPLMTSDEILEVSAYEADGQTRHEVLQWFTAIDQFLGVKGPVIEAAGVPGLFLPASASEEAGPAVPS